MRYLILLLLFVSQAFAFDSSQAFNTITFSYVDQANVSQIINLNDNQRSTITSITLSVDAKDGGGRPTHTLDGTPSTYSTQYDVSRIRIHAFNSSGTSIGTMTTTTNLKNWGSSSNPGWSNGPGDNQHPWTTASVTLDANQITGGFAGWVCGGVGCAVCARGKGLSARAGRLCAAAGEHGGDRSDAPL